MSVVPAAGHGKQKCETPHGTRGIGRLRPGSLDRSRHKFSFGGFASWRWRWIGILIPDPDDLIESGVCVVAFDDRHHNRLNIDNAHSGVCPVILAGHAPG